MLEIPTELRRFTVDEYDLMVEAGVFDEDERVELIEGAITNMSPRGTGHSFALSMVLRCFAALVAGCRADMHVQDPVRIRPKSEPEPDFALLKWREGGYRQHPEPSDVLLLVEVADSSVRHDRQVKLPIYARAGVAEVWIVDLPAKVVDVFRQPVPAESRYAEIATMRAGDSVSPAAFPDVKLAVGDLF